MKVNTPKSTLVESQSSSLIMAIAKEKLDQIFDKMNMETEITTKVNTNTDDGYAKGDDVKTNHSVKKIAKNYNIKIENDGTDIVVDDDGKTGIDETKTVTNDATIEMDDVTIMAGADGKAGIDETKTITDDAKDETK